MKALTTEHTLLIADALATSVVLAHDEKKVAAVFDVIQPIAQELAQRGRTPGGRRAILERIGNALLVSASRFRPRSPWRKNPMCCGSGSSLERFYARLEDESELKERADVLTRKLTVISQLRQSIRRYHRYRAIVAAGTDHRRVDRRQIVIAGFQLWAR